MTDHELWLLLRKRFPRVDDRTLRETAKFVNETMREFGIDDYETVLRHAEEQIARTGPSQ